MLGKSYIFPPGVCWLRHSSAVVPVSRDVAGGSLCRIEPVARLSVARNTPRQEDVRRCVHIDLV